MGDPLEIGFRGKLASASLKPRLLLGHHVMHEGHGIPRQACLGLIEAPLRSFPLRSSPLGFRGKLASASLKQPFDRLGIRLCPLDSEASLPRPH